MFANTQGAGINFGAPDVCLTPPGIPIPYPNIAPLPLGVGFVPFVFTVNGFAHNQNTTVPVSFGDEPGVIGGVASGTNMDVSTYTLCANTVITGGAPTARLTALTLQNAGNVPGATIAPSQTKVLILNP